MPILYALKHFMRSWKLFLALFVGILLASAFFAGIDIKANVTARKALDQELSQIYADYELSQPDLNSTKLAAIRDKALEINGVLGAEIISRSYLGSMTLLSENGTFEYIAATVSSIDENSRVYDGWLNKPSGGIGENETYVLENSLLGAKVKIGDVIAVNFSLAGRYEDVSFLPLTLEVKGFAALSDDAYSIASGYGQWIGPVFSGPQGYSGMMGRSDLLLVSWNKTMAKIHDISTGMYLQPTILVYVNREALISAWDVQTSISNVEAVKNDIQNKIATELGFSTLFYDALQQRLQTYLNTSMTIRFSFTRVSLPIFFVAWYMGTTVSDVSFNLRRREIGLLSTKGFSRGQILRMFLTETFLIGFVGGLLGVLVGFLLNPLFTQFSMDYAFNLQMISPYTVIFTVAFGVIIALLSTFSSARRASHLPTVDALREYMPVDTMRAYRKRLTWLALILGAYKIGVFAAGINMTQTLSRAMFAGGNFIITLLVGIWIAVDSVLNYVGPLLFFWGFTKLFIQGSLEFQALTTRLAKFLGDLGALATKNVRRNPARAAAMAFLIALIVGYSFQVTGQLASEHDFAVRQTYAQVGSDISVNLASANNASHTLGVIMTNVSDSVKNATIETSFSGQAPSGNSVTLKAVEPDSWLKTAYYEGGWFSGADAAAAFNLLRTKNDTIVIERSVARRYSLDIGGFISIEFGSMDGKTQKLEIVGFFGPDQSTDQSGVFYTGFYWSYVSNAIWEEARNYTGSSSRILIKLKDGVNSTNIAETLRKIGEPNISYVQSFSEQWEQSQSNIVTLGSLDVQRLGIVFAVLAASVGTALVSTVSLKERSREAAIMSVKGLSYKQLLVMFLAENTAIVVFSLVLGAVVGMITLNGNLAALDTMNADLVRHNLVFPLDTTLMLVSCAGLILASTIVPILIMTRNYVTNLERMVRLR
jgi:ABC-type antimicrobial peptide transport system permease subunit